MDLQGTGAIVTVGASGIGAATVAQLTAAGGPASYASIASARTRRRVDRH